MTAQKICLIGGSGFIGRHLAAQLASRDHRLTIASRRTAPPDFRVLPSAELVSADVHDPVQLAKLIAGHDAVISMVGILHGSRAQFEEAHAQLPEKIVAACRLQNVRRLVHVSALGAAQDAPSDYQQTKALGELAVESSAKYFVPHLFAASLTCSPACKGCCPFCRWPEPAAGWLRPGWKTSPARYASAWRARKPWAKSWI